MQNLRNWKAKRSGASITIEGVDAATGQPVKVSGVEIIEAGQPFAIARDARGREYELGSTQVPATQTA